MPDEFGPATPPPDAAKPGAATNLQQRIVSGVLMAALSLALTYYGPLAFALLILVVAFAMCWEWGRLVRAVPADIAFGIHAIAVGVAIGFASGGYFGFATGVIAAGALFVFFAARANRPELSALGVPYVGLPAIALVGLRQDEPHGFAAVIFLLLIVWTTDTMAFVFGRSIGGPKLWAAVSPNKTWAGFLGGIGSSAVASALFAWFVPGASSLRLALMGLGLGIVAQLGDLAESALKRSLGAKDASTLIPGHGGVMDRMDGVVTVAVLAAILGLAWNAGAPATGLIGGR